MAPKNPELEHDVQNEIRIWCGEHDLLAIRQNVGKFRALYSERVIDAGPPKGWPDLQIIGHNGHTLYCECKAKHGRLREEQKRVHEDLRRRGFTVLVPKSLEDFIKEIKAWKPH